MLNAILKSIRHLRDERRGATAVEYAVIVGVVAAGLLVAMPVLMNRLTEFFTNLQLH